MPIPLYELTFDTGHGYLDPKSCIETPRWREAPDNPIRKMKVVLPSGDFLLLAGYEAFNLFVEARTAFYGGSGTQVTALFVLGEKQGEVTSYRISLSPNGVASGDMTVRKFPKGKEYDGKPTTGWKRGI